jgi:hypothetical protein
MNNPNVQEPASFPSPQTPTSQFPSPPFTSSPAGLPTLQLFAALTGILLAGLFVSGRVYLAAKLSPFHASVTDLGLPIHEVMFASWIVVLPIVFALIPLLLSLPLLQALVVLMPQVAHFEVEAAAIQTELDDLTEQVEQLTGDGSQDDEAPPELTERVKHLVDRFHDLKSLIPEVQARLDAMESLQPFHFKRLPPLFPWPALAIALLLIAWLAILVALDGWQSALLSFSKSLLVGAIFAAIGLSAYGILRARASVSKLAIALTLVFVVVLPYPALSGLLTGLADRYDSSAPGSGFAQVTIWSDQKLQPDWQPSRNWYESPKLRLIGEHAGWLTLWNPQSPGTAIQVPATSVTLLQRQ